MKSTNICLTAMAWKIVNFAYIFQLWNRLIAAGGNGLENGQVDGRFSKTYNLRNLNCYHFAHYYRLNRFEITII